MIRSSLSLLAAVGGALALAAPAHAAAAGCTTSKPATVKVTPNAAGTSLKVTWRKPKHAAAKLSFRVARDGAVVGQTRARSMRVRTSAGATPKITVTAVVKGRTTRCRVTVQVVAGPGPAQ